MARYIVYYDLGASEPRRMKYIDDATAAPDANDDAATLGVTVGSLWLDTTNHRIYIAESVGTGAAVWTELTGTGSVAAASVSVADSGGHFTGTDVESVLAELATTVEGDDFDSLHTDLSVSGAHTMDRDDGATHDLTLTGDTTLTPDAGSLSGVAIDLRGVIRQDGTGGHTLAFGGTITWAGGSAPTMPTDPDAVLTLGFLSLDDGTTWLGFAATGGSSVGALDDLSDVTITAAAEGDLLRFNGTAWVDTTLRPEPMIDSAGGVQLDSAGGPQMHEVAW